MTWRLDDGVQTLVLAPGDGLPWVAYWGPSLPGSEDLDALVAAAVPDLTGGMLDVLPPPSLCPGTREGFQGQPGLEATDAEGRPVRPRFVAEVAASEGALEVWGRCAQTGLAYRARIAVAMPGVLALQAWLEAAAPIRLHWFAAPVLPGPEAAEEIIDVSGRWTREFHLSRTPWSQGARLREARTGRSGHEHPPLALLPTRGATETAGLAYALHYAWSGGHRMVAEELPSGARQIQMGHVAGSHVAPATAFETAPLYAALSERGLGGVGVAFQRLIRDRVVPWPDPARPRPVHMNCWEAVYFDHRLDQLSEIADRAAALGAERFVLDDGWFGRRDDDTTSLGDWTVDRRKWPDGLGPLISHVQGLGMTFGLWVEPEMVNAASDLCRAHPDWVLGPADQVTGRGQLMLDMGRAEVRDHLFAALSALLTAYPIDYLKWDHNRLPPWPDMAQTTGTYALLDRLRAAHPAVEIESCASGGGRIDAGILARTHRVWLSDCNDAVERLRMQHDAALMLPAAVTGSHIGPRRAHTTGRTVGMAFRAWVAAMRHMGLELDPREMTEAEADVARRVIAWWKATRGWRMGADILRLDAGPGTIAEVQVAADGARFVAFAGRVETGPEIVPGRLRLAGLVPEARYEVRLANPEDIPGASRGPVALKAGPVTLTGASLMAAGIALPLLWPETLYVLEGRRL